ncbi:hypothetical protein SAMN04487974_12011 [Pelagibacterium luteolum]|uniref:Uncharacterized protein n=1 Tax=Pelagibacterium luteolum TaxID=440168 RepID=A0A1G7ZH61_9HYPH|nr:hypothetical protein SAMN04487974_12011 [Pelagibacterium luteolum]
MRFSWTVACALIAWECANMATGLSEQVILSDRAVWLWWVPAFFWVLAAIRTAAGWYDD